MAAPRPADAAAPTSSTGLAWVVVVIVGGLMVLVVLAAAFGGHNTPSSIEGRTATTSQFVE